MATGSQQATRGAHRRIILHTSHMDQLHNSRTTQRLVYLSLPVMFGKKVDLHGNTDSYPNCLN